MDVLALPRLRAQLGTPAWTRKLAVEIQRGGEAARDAGERLGRSDTPRPDGTLIWCHLPGTLESGALLSLRERLRTEQADLSLLVTTPDVGRCRKVARETMLLCQLPPLDAPAMIQRFLDHWRPDAAIWFERVDAPLLLEAAAHAGIPLFLQDATAPDVASTRARARERYLMGLFERVFAQSVTDHESIRALGPIPTRIEASGRLTPIAHPPSCLEAERAALAAALRSRPVWLASCPDPDELDWILEAHRQARRSAHRLLLILVPRSDAEGRPLAERLRADGWVVARRDADEEPDEGTDIFVADSREELGLFYRLAPVTFLGGTLSNSAVPAASDPATLGSAIIAGPFTGNEAEMLRRLRRGGACRLVPDAARLGAAVTELLAPDRAAQLALNAWEIASDGSPVMDRLVGALLPALREGPA
ncbi:3-deoxy-D-manno-octulosonic acid transferase [Tropicimonas sp. IMCC6043]|uniref:3-deoxy-D-manno-octulosonic acid transferase n=1 Tax=Tropicimonas sp. IMCC6043 TaxID=2510645 RepID=UPI00101C76B8|nr:glycosyltransferase N-terminal domain-containing protein [Tropicimonas sp. IMCC6043]RYH08681.1 3-deoxy-D-manno-octulosonic acid transferase [Tropicimonas sp. IMCC6043]